MAFTFQICFLSVSVLQRVKSYVSCSFLRLHCGRLCVNCVFHERIGPKTFDNFQSHFVRWWYALQHGRSIKFL